ncbi:MAG: DUF1329 domain-containing protein [Candidatus Binataceae bacterium]
MKLHPGFRAAVLAVVAIVFAFSATCYAAGGGETAGAAATIPQGTVITLKNWQQYKGFMPYGMQQMFAGTYHWKFPASFQMEIGPRHHYAPPKTFTENTEKYASQVKVVNLPNGGHSISGYVAGLPFPNPTDPMKGYKILVNEWYRYVPYIICSAAYGYQLILEDRFGNETTLATPLVYRRLSHISDYDYPITDPHAQGIDYSEWVEVLLPEQDKYTQNLTLYYNDPSKPEVVVLFIPALRRSLRLSTAARCAPFVGTDWTQDDVRTGFNGGIVRWDSTFLREQPVITLTTVDRMKFSNWKNYYPGVIWPEPSWAKYETRPSYVIDVRRIPSERAGYCYGKQIMYVDKENYDLYWKDIYDSSMKYWKALVGDHIASPVPHEGMQFETGNLIERVYDMQSAHFSIVVSSDPRGNWDHNNGECKNYNGMNYDNVVKYSTAAGLALVLR